MVGEVVAGVERVMVGCRRGRRRRGGGVRRRGGRGGRAHRAARPRGGGGEGGRRGGSGDGLLVLLLGLLLLPEFGEEDLLFVEEGSVGDHRALLGQQPLLVVHLVVVLVFYWYIHLFICLIRFVRGL